MKLDNTRHAWSAPLALAAALTGLMLASPATAASGDQRVPPARPGQIADDKSRIRSTSLPAHKLFQGDQLSAGPGPSCPNWSLTPWGWMSRWRW